MPFWSSWFKKSKYNVLAPNKYETPVYDDITKIEMVRNNVLVSTCVRVVSHHLARLEWNVEKKDKFKGQDWELKWWKDYMEGRGKRLIVQMYTHAWAYNTGIAWAEFDQTQVFQVPKDIVIMPMRNVNDLGDRSFRYKNVEYQKDECFVWRLAHPEEEKVGLSLYEAVDGLRILNKTERRGRIIHALGIHYLDWVAPTKPEEEDLKWRDNWINQLGTSELIAGGHYGWRPTVQFGQPASADQEIIHARDEILTKFGLQWLAAGTWTTGTKASVELQVRSYLDDLDGLADMFQTDLQLFADRMAKRNGFDSTNVKFVHSTPALPEPIAEYLTAIEIAKRLNLTPAEKRIIYPKLGLPEEEEIDDEDADLASSPKSAFNETEAKALDDKLLSSRKNICKDAFKTCVKNSSSGMPWKFGISGLQEIAESLRVTKEDLRKIINSYKSDFVKAIRDLAKEEAEESKQDMTFETIWKAMEEEIKKLSLKVRQANG